MFGILLSSLIAAAPIAAPQERLFEEAHGWRVFKTAGGCTGFFNQPGTLSVSVFYPNNREVLTLIIQHADVPALSDTKQTIFLRAGRAQWGPADGTAYRGDSGLPGVLFGVKRSKALAEFGKANEIAVTKRFNPPRVIPLVATDKAADMLARCVG